MAWSTSNYFPEWGDSGERPSDGFQYDGGDQVNEKHLDYFLNALDEFEDDVWAALEDIDSDSDGTVDDSDQFAGTGPSDGSEGETITTDGTDTSWGAPAIVSDSRPPVADSGVSWVRTGDPGTAVFNSDSSNLPTNPTNWCITADGDTIYAGYDDGVAAFDVDGSHLWTVDTADLGGDSVRAIDVQGDTVFCVSGTEVFALSVSDGSEEWSHSHHSDRVEDITAHGASVYSGGQAGEVIAVDIKDGSQRWSHSEEGDGVLAIDTDGEYVYSGGNDNLVRADVSDGSTTVYSYSTPRPIGHLSVDDGVLYIYEIFFGTDARAVAWDAEYESGGLIWERVIGTTGFASYSNGVMYHCRRNNSEIEAMDAESGNILWTSQEISSIEEAFAHRGVLYVGRRFDAGVRGMISDKARYTSDGDEWLFESRLR